MKKQEDEKNIQKMVTVKQIVKNDWSGIEEEEVKVTEHQARWLTEQDQAKEEFQDNWVKELEKMDVRKRWKLLLKPPAIMSQ